MPLARLENFEKLPHATPISLVAPEQQIQTPSNNGRLRPIAAVLHQVINTKSVIEVAPKKGKFDELLTKIDSLAAQYFD